MEKLNLLKSLRVFLLTAMAMSSLACSIDATLGDMVNQPLPEGIKTLSRTSPDFVSGEVVTSATGYRMRAVIGEVVEKRTLPNGYKVDGAFYE